MSLIIDGKKISKRILEDTAQRLLKKDETPKLGIILASNDISSKVYVKLKQNDAHKLGIKTELYEFKEKVGVENIIYQINQFNLDKNINGVLIQLPLFEKYRDKTKFVINSLNYKKDVDGLTAIQQGLASQFMPKSIIPAAVEAVLESLNEVFEHDLTWENILMNYQTIDCLKGLVITIINNSNLLGKPLSMIFSNLGASVIILNEYSKDIQKHTSKSDIIISGTGKGNLIGPEMVKENSILIDVTSIKLSQRVTGDFIFNEEMISKIKAYTPVPGGIGPITVACLMRNLSK